MVRLAPMAPWLLFALAACSESAAPEPEPASGVEAQALEDAASMLDERPPEGDAPAPGDEATPAEE